MNPNLVRIALTLLIIGAMLSSPRSSVGEVEVVDPECIKWNVTYGNWLYRASAGGYGTVQLSQVLSQNEIDYITGSFWNQAIGGGGTLTGHINGKTLNLRSSADEWLEATVSPDGTNIGGPLKYGDYNGTWEADGVATCLERKPEPPAGSASCEVGWGEYRFSSCTASEPVSAVQEAQQATGVATINTSGAATLTIQARFFGQNLPATITVVILVNGQETVIGQLTRVSQDSNSALYRGTVTVPGTGLAPGVSRINRVRLIDPNDPNRRVPVIIVSQFLIDPAGNIYDANTSQVIEGATVTNYQKQGDDWVIWPAENFGQTNPLVSDSDGHYAWMTDAGDFLVKATMEGYLDGSGGPVTVPPEVTDLHIYLTPTTAPAPEASGLQISDGSGQQQEAYKAGEHLQIHFAMTNTQPSDVEATLAWTTTDPEGRVVPSLSGTDTYVLGSFSVDPKIPIAIPATASEGWYTLRVEVTYEGQTRFQGTQFFVEPTHALFLPLGVQGFHAEKPGWNIILEEGFEGPWPGPWDVLSGSQGGDYRWGKRDCRANQGAYSAWGVGGGNDGSGLSCGSNYPNDANSWLLYGPFSLEGATAADLTFQVWVNTAQSSDKLFWGASLNNNNFYGYSRHGDSGGWLERTLNLADVPTLGNLMGESQVWIGLKYSSDSANTTAEGGYVDELVLRKHIGPQNTLEQTVPMFGLSAGTDARLQPASQTRGTD